MSVLYDDVRPAAVAGMFYPGDEKTLRRDVLKLCGKQALREKALGVMVPHAGYVYSGALCGRALAGVEIPPTVLILHTKHQAGGGALSLAAFEHWQTPLGDVETDHELTDALANLPGIVVSNRPHTRDHAAEVVLPFLQVLRPAVKIAVISVGHFEENLATVAAAIARAIKSHKQPVLVVSSSDMNHYESHALTLSKDEHALAKLRACDAPVMLAVCEHENISMCGAYATALMLEICRALGATRARVLEHTTSGPTSGDMEQVVGYATAVVS